MVPIQPIAIPSTSRSRLNQQMRPRTLIDRRTIYLLLLGYSFGWLSYKAVFEPTPPQSLLTIHTGGWGTWNNEEQGSPIYPAIQSIFIVTPTYRRSNQLAELTRLAQALYPSRKYIASWLIYQDSTQTGHSEFLNHLGFVRKHLQKIEKDLQINIQVQWTVTARLDIEQLIGRPKGVEARRDALAFVRNQGKEGVIYFADDDNTYDSDIFRQISTTKGVSVFPVGCVTKLGISAPVIPEGQKQVSEIFDGWKVNRRFPLDFAGFAVNIQLLHENKFATIPFITSYEETKFLTSLKIPLKKFEALSPNQVLTWHTKTLTYYFDYPLIWGKVTPFRLVDTNVEFLYKECSFIRDDPPPLKTTNTRNYEEETLSTASSSSTTVKILNSSENFLSVSVSIPKKAKILKRKFFARKSRKYNVPLKLEY